MMQIDDANNLGNVDRGTVGDIDVIYDPDATDGLHGLTCKIEKRGSHLDDVDVDYGDDDGVNDPDAKDHL